MAELTSQDFKNIHTLIEREFNFSGGVRDPSTLDAVVNRPEHGFYGTDPFPDIFMKAASIFEGIVCWQPFNDGNKRSALVITRVYLAEHGYSFFIPFSAVRFTVQIAMSKPKNQQQINHRLKRIARWIRLRSAKSMSRMAEWKYNAYVGTPLALMAYFSSKRITRPITMRITFRWFAFDIYPEYQTDWERMLALILQLATDSYAGSRRFTGLNRLYRELIGKRIQRKTNNGATNSNHQ